MDKANIMIGLMRGSVVHMDEDICKNVSMKIYISLVKPHPQYVQTSLFSTKIKDIKATKNVQ